MNRQPDSMEETLRIRGLSPKRARRITLELRDHLACATQEYMDDGYAEAKATDMARKRIGDDAVIIDLALAEMGSRAWPHRHPFVLFFMMPIAVVGMTMGFYGILARGAGRMLIDRLGMDVADPIVFLCACMAYVSIAYIMWLIAAAGFCIIAHRYRCRVRWSLLVCLTLATMAGLSYVYLSLPVGVAGTNSVAYGMDVSSRIPRIIIPIAVFTLFAAYEKRTNRLAF